MNSYRVVGINFDHQHMGDLLRQVQAHPNTEVVGVAHRDESAMRPVLDRLGLDPGLMHTDAQRCIDESKPDLAVICPSTADHAPVVIQMAHSGLHTIVEKPFAASLADADAMIAAFDEADRQLAINWPLAWYPPHRTTKRLIDEGAIGEVINIHYYDGNRGPVRHGMDKIEVSEQELIDAKRKSWFYRADQGGGAMRDYLGYGVTLATWYNGGKKPIEVTATADTPEGLEVDEHAVVVARYAKGLSKFETRWGTFTDPWTHQPQPKCGFVVCGTQGTISSYDFEPHVRVQTHDHPEGYDVPVDALTAPHTDPITYFVHCLEQGQAVEGPLSPALSRIGQQIVDTACRSAEKKRTLPLIP